MPSVFNVIVDGTASVIGSVLWVVDVVGAVVVVSAAVVVVVNGEMVAATDVVGLVIDTEWLVWMFSVVSGLLQPAIRKISAKRDK